MGSVSEVARDVQRANAIAIPNTIPNEQHDKVLQEVTVMQGSIWQYSDSQPWFIVGLHKNNPTATREALESLMKLRIEEEELRKLHHRSKNKRRGKISLRDGKDNNKGDRGDSSSLCDSQGRRVMMNSQSAVMMMAGSGEGDEKLNAPDNNEAPAAAAVAATAADLHKREGKGSGSSRLTLDIIGDMYTGKKMFFGPPETKIVIKKTVELIGDMNKSSELVFHAVRACARFLTYPTPSIPSDNCVFGHVKGWIWLVYKGLSHFNHELADKKCLDSSLKTFRREMSLLAKEANGCMADLNFYLQDLRKLNLAIRKEAAFLKKKHKKVWAAQMEKYFHFVDELKSKRHLLVDVSEDRFFPTDWFFEPHPSATKLQWDFFHFQWVNLNRGWIDSEFEIRSDYSLHWKKFTSFAPELQTEIIVHLIQHLRALVEECHNFHKENLHFSFDLQEIKFLKFAVEEIGKLKRHGEAITFITGITKKLFDDLALLERISEEYIANMEWVVTVIEPCYYTIDRWLADDLIQPLEVHTKTRRSRIPMCACFRRKKSFIEVYGEPLKVVLMRTPISIEQLDKFFPSSERIKEDVILPSAPLNTFGLSKEYRSSIFDPGLGRDQPLPLHHPLPKYKKQKQQPTFNIFNIHRLIEATVDCIIVTKKSEQDIDTEKYLVIVEEVQRFLAVFSTIFTYVMADLKERVETLEALMYNNLPEHYGSFEEMILYEKSRQCESAEKSGVKTVARLHRIFQFVVLFLEKVNTLEDGEITFYAAKSAYYKSYGRSQSWIYQKAAVFSMYSLPHKMDMFNSLFTDSERPKAVKSINEFVEQGTKLLDICENIFKANGLVIP